MSNVELHVVAGSVAGELLEGRGELPRPFSLRLAVLSVALASTSSGGPKSRRSSAAMKSGSAALSTSAATWLRLARAPFGEPIRRKASASKAFTSSHGSRIWSVSVRSTEPVSIRC